MKSDNDFVYNLESTRNFQRKITEGWKLLLKTQNLFSDIDDPKEVWIPLKILKETKLILTAKYVVANSLDLIPAFQLWVPQVLRNVTR